MAARASRIGQQLGHYQLAQLLGTGGFAEVYLGEHVHLHTQVAMKLLHTQIADDDRENFKHEAQTIARLLHPHIVRVLDFGVEGNTPYLVMDYAPNGTLRHRHPRGTPLPLATVISYTKQVAEALQYAHDQRLIHRDVKPENMLLGRNQEVLLSDFGIALVTQSSQYQSTQNIAGTIAYMAPEQIQAHPRPASDQYSLGIIVYEWLSGQRPFQGSYTEIAVKHSVAHPPPLHDLLPALPSAVEQVVMIALNKDPHQRFANVRAFAQALEQASQQLSTTFIRPPVTPQPSIAPMTSLSGRPVISTPPVLPIGPASGISGMSTMTPPQIPANILPQNSSGSDVHSTPLQHPQVASPYFPPTAMPTPAPSYLPPPNASTAVPPYVRPQHSQRSISRRTFVIGTVGLAAASSAAT
ncbi:MAG TPA: protein kinase [Ktedonobacteraceae bacterium]|jgi:serine/threonine protein kinase